MQTTYLTYVNQRPAKRATSVSQFGIRLFNCLPAILFLLFAIVKADAVTVTIDGTVTPLTIVSNATYQTDDLVLVNGASLVAASNAVIHTIYIDLATPGSTVTMNSGSRGGQIGGQGA